MVRSNKHIEIVRSADKALSSMSQASCDAVFAVLAKHFTTVGVSVIENISDLEDLVATSPDLVFLGMEFVPQNPAKGMADHNKIWLSDYLEAHDIAFTGSSQEAHELGRNKALAKQRVLEDGLNSPPFCVIKQGQTIPSALDSMRFPLFIKPINRGGGLGIDSASVAYNLEQVRSKTYSITLNQKSHSLVEEYLPGREFSVAILKQVSSANYSVMPIELIAPPDHRGIRMLSGRVKTLNIEQAIEVTDKITRSKVAEFAMAVFHALGARDYGRIDIRLDIDGMPQFLEANLLPSLIRGYGSFPKACVLNEDLNYESMIMRIVELGLVRNAFGTKYGREPSAASDHAFSLLKTIPEPA